MTHPGGVRRFLILACAGALALVTGCAKAPPQSVADVNAAINQAKAGCASVFAAQDLAPVQAKVDEMNRLAGEKKYRKSGKIAEPLLPEIKTVAAKSDEAKAKAKADADAAVARAEKALDSARQAESEKYAAADYNGAKAKLDDAKRKAGDPCTITQATAVAGEAAAAADKTKAAAIAEKDRLEKERLAREAEERRLREAEEARRRAEAEEVKKKTPETYVVQKGDYLWRISGKQEIYGKPIFWPVIYDANGNIISNANLIFPGQELRIPRDLSEEQRMEEVRKAWSQETQGGAAPKTEEPPKQE